MKNQPSALGDCKRSVAERHREDDMNMDANTSSTEHSGNGGNEWLPRFRFLFVVSVVVCLTASCIMNVLPPGFDRGIGGIIVGALVACLSVASAVAALIALLGWLATEKRRPRI